MEWNRGMVFGNGRKCMLALGQTAEQPMECGDGFVYPHCDRDSVPELDWSVIFVFRNQEWTTAKKLLGKNATVFRIAIPARTG